MNQSRVVRAQEEPLIQGWYSERFGSLEPNSVLEFSVQGTSHCVFGYAISMDIGAKVREIKQDKYGLSIFVEHNSKHFSFTLTSYTAEESVGT